MFLTFERCSTLERFWGGLLVSEYRVKIEDGSLLLRGELSPLDIHPQVFQQPISNYRLLHQQVQGGLSNCHGLVCECSAQASGLLLGSSGLSLGYFRCCDKQIFHVVFQPNVCAHWTKQITMACIHIACCHQFLILDLFVGGLLITRESDVGDCEVVTSCSLALILIYIKLKMKTNFYARTRTNIASARSGPPADASMMTVNDRNHLQSSSRASLSASLEGARNTYRSSNVYILVRICVPKASLVHTQGSY